jgi:hypothetical protein
VDVRMAEEPENLLPRQSAPITTMRIEKRMRNTGWSFLRRQAFDPEEQALGTSNSAERPTGCRAGLRVGGGRD